MEYKDLITIAGICISLCWNFTNSYVSHRNWTRSNKLTEFRKVREPVDKALGEFRSLKREVRSLQTFGGAQKDFVLLLEEINKKVVETYNNLSISLEIIDASSQIDGENWEIKASEKWDDLNDKMNLLYTVLPDHQRRDALSKLERSIESLTYCISNELDCVVDQMLRFWKIPKKRVITIPAFLIFFGMVCYSLYQSYVPASLKPLPVEAPVVEEASND